MKEITEKNFSEMLKNILADQDCPKPSSAEAEVFSMLNEQIDTLLSQLALNKSNLTESNQSILHDAILTEIHKILTSEGQNQMTVTVIIQAFQMLTEKYIKTSIPAENIYFSDDIAVLPGDGEVMLIGDPRANWKQEAHTSEEGFRPLYLHRDELDNPQTKIKIENFLKLQKQNKNNIISARVNHVTYLILEMHNHYNPLVDKYDAVGLIEYLSGSPYDQNKAEKRISKLSSVKKFLEEFFTSLYENRHTGMTTERILESAQALSKQKIHTITPAAKKTIFSAIHTLSQKPYSQTLINYFANRPDFVILVYPDDTTLPNLFKLSNAGRADQYWNMISIAGTNRYNIHDSLSKVHQHHSFIIHKKSNARSSILYGGYAYYSYKFDPIQKEYNFIENYEHLMAEHGSQKPESLLIEELSDLANVFLGGKDAGGDEIPAIIKVPTNIGWLSKHEREQFIGQLDALNQSCLFLKKISDKLIQGKSLNEIEEKSWNALKNKLIEYEKNITFYRRHILSDVNLSDFPSIKKGDKIATSKDSRWAGATIEVMKIKMLPGNKATLHLIAPPLEKDHQLHHWVLDDLLFQIHKALHPGPPYQDKTYWLPMETMGRLRGILDNYPLAKDLLSEVIPSFDIIDKKIKAAIHQQFFEPREAATTDFLFMEDDALSICPARFRNELPMHSHPAINRLSFFNEKSELYLPENNPEHLQFGHSPPLLSDGNMPQNSNGNPSLYLGAALFPGVILSLLALYLIYRALRPMSTSSEDKNKESQKNMLIVRRRP